MNSQEIKIALMEYFRYKRQWLCATECLDNDVMAITKSDEILDIEIKISKSDLWNGEAKKPKHKQYKVKQGNITKCNPNKFYICVPTVLREEAEKWILKTNEDYGLFIYTDNRSDPILLAIPAKVLHKSDNKVLIRKIMMRVCSENIGLRVRLNKEK